MSTLTLVRAQMPVESENSNLRRTLDRLTYGTHDRRRGFVLLPSEAQALYRALSHCAFSIPQLAVIEQTIREIDPLERGSTWNSRKYRSFIRAKRYSQTCPDWIDKPIDGLHTAMHSLGPNHYFRVRLLRAVMVIFITTPDPNPSDFLAG